MTWNWLVDDILNMTPEEKAKIEPTLQLIARGREYLRIDGKDPNINNLARGLKWAIRSQT